MDAVYLVYQLCLNIYVIVPFLKIPSQIIFTLDILRKFFFKCNFTSISNIFRLKKSVYPCTLEFLLNVINFYYRPNGNLLKKHNSNCPYTVCFSTLISYFIFFLHVVLTSTATYGELIVSVYFSEAWWKFSMWMVVFWNCKRMDTLSFVRIWLSSPYSVDGTVASFNSSTIFTLHVTRVRWILRPGP